MSAAILDFLTSGSSGKSTRTLLRVIILSLIAGAAIASRLFSVIRMCPFPVSFVAGELCKLCSELVVRRLVSASLQECI